MLPTNKYQKGSRDNGEWLRRGLQSAALKDKLLAP